MAISKQTLHKLGLTLWLATTVAMPNASNAAPGTLASVPLFTQGNVDPNILLHLDSSGSMNHVMVESSYSGTPTYDASTTYDADPNDILTTACIGGLIPAGSTVYLAMDTSGATPVPKINYNDGTGAADYDLGNNAGEKCFDPTQNYQARLTTYPTLPATLIYSGNYLNWYFNPSTTTGTWSSWSAATATATGYTNYKKPLTRSRMDVAQASLTSLVNSLSNVRVGVSKFRIQSSPANYGLGADITQTIGDISTNRAAVLTAISNIVGHGGTPLAEAERDIGRYFSNATTTAGTDYACGGGSTNLTLHPGSTNNSEACTDVLGNVAPIKNLQGPIQYSCQANFVIYTTDGLSTHDIGQNSGSGYDLISNTPLADYDLDCTNIPVDGGGNPLYSCSSYDKKSTYTYTTHTEASDYLDDVAQALYEVDLRPDLNDVNGNAVTNNVRTYVIGFADDDVVDNQLLKDTASQGGGTFTYAGDSSALASAFDAATSSVLNLIGSAAAVTFNSATLGTDSAVYLALFNSSSWTGDLIAYDLNDTTGAIQSQTWSAADNLDALTDANAVSNRVILTYNGSQGVAFRWPADYTAPNATTELSSAQISDLLTNPGTAATTAELTALGQARVDFLRGKTSLEGTSLYNTTFRSRNSRMGDVIHAGPIYVGPPELNWPDGVSGVTGGFPYDTNAYSYYKVNTSIETPAGRADRPGVVYVGSNDGMLHGFATENGALGSAGDEVLAYAPKALFSTSASRGYHYLTENGYNHQYYVDLQPTVSDIYTVTNSPSTGDGFWSTILVGGLRGGGRGFYALNVTDPASFSEANAASIVMGEFTNADDADLGYTFSQPTIGMMEDGRWAIIVGNGYNPDTTITDANGSTASGEATLYIIYLDADLTDGKWDLSGATIDYRKYSLGIGTTADLNGLSSPTAVDLDNNGKIDRVYAGDLKGNMWVFDFRTTNTNNWGSAYNQGPNPKPLFSAGVNQPITVQPEVAFNPDGDNATDFPNTLVLFGTGQYIASGDNSYNSSTPQGDQAFYGIWDHGTKEITVAGGTLIEQVLVEDTTAGTRTITDATVDYAGSDDGWYINFNLNSDGERMVTNPVIRGDYVYFNTSIPTNATCAYGGTGWQMAVNYKNGHNPSSVIVDTNGDGVINADDTITAGMTFDEGLPAAPNFLGNRRYTPGTKTQDGTEVVDDVVEEISTSGTGRLSWEELVQ